MMSRPATQCSQMKIIYPTVIDKMGLTFSNFHEHEVGKKAHKCHNNREDDYVIQDPESHKNITSPLKLLNENHLK